MAKITYEQAALFETPLYQSALHDVTNQTEIVDESIAELSKPCELLDKLIDEVTYILANNKTLSDSDLDFYIMQIPLQLYYLNEYINHLETQENVASVSRKIAYNEARLHATGTVADKDAIAERSVEPRTLVNLVFTQSRKLMQSKRDIAIELLNSLKKVSSRRISEYELSRFSSQE